MNSAYEEIEYPEDQRAAEQKRQMAALSDRSGISGLSVADLRKLRSSIDNALPSNKLRDIDLEEEMVAQLQVSKDLQEEALADGDAPYNQKAQCLNAVASSIQSLVKMQIDLKRDEQLKRMEAALMKAVAMMDEEHRLVFFDTYERLALTEGVEING